MIRKQIFETKNGVSMELFNTFVYQVGVIEKMEDQLSNNLLDYKLKGSLSTKSWELGRNVITKFHIN